MLQHSRACQQHNRAGADNHDADNHDADNHDTTTNNHHDADRNNHDYAGADHHPLRVTHGNRDVFIDEPIVAVPVPTVKRDEHRRDRSGHVITDTGQ